MTNILQDQIKNNVDAFSRSYRSFLTKTRKGNEDLPPCYKCGNLRLHHCGVTGYECEAFKRYVIGDSGLEYDD